MFMSCRVVVITFVLALIADNKTKAGTTTAPKTTTNSTNTTILTTTTNSTTVILTTVTAHSTTVMPTTNSSSSSSPISTSTSPFTTTTEFDTSTNETDHTNSSSAITSTPTVSTAEALTTTQPHSTTFLETTFTESNVSSIPSSVTSAESPRTSTPLVSMTQLSNSAIGSSHTDPRVTSNSNNSMESINSSSSTMPTSKQPTENHSYLTFPPLNGSCTQYYGYKLTDQQNLCVSICEDKKCENGGVCEVVQELPDDTTKLKPRCRCKESSDEIFEGENCEVSKLGRWKERAITLGVLIPLACLALLILICTCRKLTRHGKAERDFRNKYNVNTGNL